MDRNRGGGPPQIYGIIFIIFVTVISLLGSWLSLVVVRDLGLKEEKAFLAFAWRVVFFSFLFIFFPMSVAIEIMFSRWKKRKLRVHSVLAVALLLFVYMLVLSLIGFIFEEVFPSLYFTNEPFLGLTGLVLGFMVMLPLLIVVFTARARKIHAYIRKAFE
ncbi:MAG: hypothetical protein WCD81_06630 [Candidatus Bathyarchaeia archaeon]